MPEPTSFTVEASAIRTQADVLAMVDFRLGIESEAAYLAAAHRTKAGAEAVRAALEAFSAAGPEEAVEADFAFHRAVAAASGNRFYVDLLDSHRADDDHAAAHPAARGVLAHRRGTTSSGCAASTTTSPRRSSPATPRPPAPRCGCTSATPGDDFSPESSYLFAPSPDHAADPRDSEYV